MTIGEVIRVSRRAKGWTLKGLAALSGVPEMTISSIEKGNVANPGILTCYRIGRAFGDGLDLFIGVEELTEAKKRKEGK